MNLSAVGLTEGLGALERATPGVLGLGSTAASSLGGALFEGLGAELHPDLGEAMNSINALGQLASTLGQMSSEATQQATSDPQTGFRSFSQMTQQQGGTAASASLADLIDGGDAVDA